MTACIIGAIGFTTEVIDIMYHVFAFDATIYWALFICSVPQFYSYAYYMNFMIKKVGYNDGGDEKV